MNEPDPRFVMMVLTDQGSTSPVVRSRDPMPYCCVPLSEAKLPPTISRPLLGWETMVATWSSAVGAHGSSAPVDALTAARRDLGWPATVVNTPPM